jgi:hypothetical protein
MRCRVQLPDDFLLASVQIQFDLVAALPRHLAIPPGRDRRCGVKLNQYTASSPSPWDLYLC